MAYNQEFVKTIIRDISAEVVNGDESLFNLANNSMKTFLEESSLTDTEKAKNYTMFLTNLSTTAVQQIVQMGGQIALDYQLKEAETAKILAETKYNVEHLFPAQKDKLVAEKDLINIEKDFKDYQTKSILPNEKDKLIAEKELLSSQKDKLVAEKDLINIEKDFKDYQTKSILPNEKDKLIAEKELLSSQKSFISTQIEYYEDKIEAEISVLNAEFWSKKAQIQGAIAEISIKKAQIDEIGANIFKLNKEAEKLVAEKVSLGQDGEFKLRQADGVERGIKANLEIEKLKAQNQLEIAGIQAMASV